MKVVIFPSIFSSAKHYYQRFIWVLTVVLINPLKKKSFGGKRMERSYGSEDQLPPGFRFHPTDEELIVFYLRNQASSKPCPSSIISQIDIYKFDPWELPGKAEYGESEWYFFSRRDRKYPNGVRPNRATVSGYWKATGTDKAIYSKTKYVGVKKSLVFYKGKPPKGIKTSWIMHEYRLAESTKHPNRQTESMRLDDWVLCRIYKKRHIVKQFEGEVDDLPAKNAMEEAFEASDQQMLKLPRTFSINHQLGLDYFGSISISHLLNDNSLNSSVGGPANFVKFEQGEMSGELETKQNSYVNQSVFANPSFNGSYLFDP